MENQKIPSAQDSLRWMVLLTVIIATALGRLDQVVVNLAIPKVMSEFSITVQDAAWIATAYILANSILVPVWGKLGDTIGRKRVYLFGFIVFVAGSMLAGMAWNLSSMLVFRVIQAVASSADYPTAMAIIAVTFTDVKERATALGIWAAGAGVGGAVLGPLVGGLLIDTFGWRSVFYINLPIGLIGIAMALVFIKESVSEQPTKQFDLGGAIALGTALAALVLVIDKGSDWGWLSTNSLLAYLTVAVFGFIFYRIDRNHPDPIVDFKFFKIEAFDSALVNNFLVAVEINVGIFLIPVFAQTFLGFSAKETGYMFIPMVFAMILGTGIGSRFIGKVRIKYVLAISSLIGALGPLLLAMTLDPRSTALDLILSLSILTFGFGLGMAQRMSIIPAVVPTKEVGVASSVLMLVQNLGGAFGIAAFSAMLTGAAEDSVIALSRYSIVNTVNPLLRGQAMVLMGLKANIDAYRMMFWYVALLVLATAVVALVTLNIKDEMEKMKGIEKAGGMEMVAG
ncbi:MAG: DHA2 family efflux MFS transporter permease subunit [Chloroflexi bacterium]|nr:DHA2 family efflux MFS transporter permease subunit [Chloroflexota bacterium]